MMNDRLFKFTLKNKYGELIRDIRESYSTIPSGDQRRTLPKESCHAGNLNIIRNN